MAVVTGSAAFSEMPTGIEDSVEDEEDDFPSVRGRLSLTSGVSSPGDRAE